jgi:hypothetical protein
MPAADAWGCVGYGIFQQKLVYSFQEKDFDFYAATSAPMVSQYRPSTALMAPGNSAK